MGYVNGAAGPSVTAPEPATVATQGQRNSPEGNKTDLQLLGAQALESTRFMPVMDIALALKRREMIVSATKQLMQEGVDYGKVPGADRDVLLQPGADKLCNLFGLVIQYEVTKQVEDWTGETHGGQPFFFYEVKGRAFRGDFLMGEGIGSCNAWESKYRWRKGERTCPTCGKPTILKSKHGDGWFCWAKRDGCGANFPPGDPQIEKQEVGRRPNPDMADCVNTVLKMALKRAKVSTTINATSASEFFTQDVEDAPQDQLPDWIDIGNNPPNSRAAQQYVAEQKIAQGRARTAQPEPLPDLPLKTADIRRAFSVVREQIGEVRYMEELQLAAVTDPLQFKSREKANACYHRMIQISRLKEVA